MKKFSLSVLGASVFAVMPVIAGAAGTYYNGSTYQSVVDHISQRNIAFLSTLESQYFINVDGLNIAFVHGTIDNPLNGRIYPDTKIEDETKYSKLDYVFCGHTHHKMTRVLSCGTVLINPGSIGQQRDGKGCTYVLFDSVSKKFSFKEIMFNREKLVEEIKAHRESEDMEKRLIEVLYRDNRKI